MNILRGATAVAKSKIGESVLATNEGIFLKKNGIWNHSLIYNQRKIRDITFTNNRIFGVGDNGIFISSYDGGDHWSIKQFPTKASIWNIVTNSSDMLITHGEKVLYVSLNSGQSWMTHYPFSFKNAPSIRSICLYGNYLFIGTKVHSKYGGIWCYNLRDQSIKQLKKVKNKMISSMIIVKDQLIIATGSCRGEVGKIEFCSLSDIATSKSWETCDTNENQSFLDLNENDGVIYATSAQNQDGWSTIYKVCIQKKAAIPCNRIKGHGWRISNNNEDYIVAGLYESMEYVRSNLSTSL